MDTAQPQPEKLAEPPQAASETELLAKALALWLELRELSLDHFRLAALETQRAGLSLITMLVAGIMLAIMLNGIWFGLMAALVAGLLENGLALSSAILLTTGLSLLAALILIVIIRRKSHYLSYPALRRSLKPQSTPQRKAKKSK